MYIFYNPTKVGCLATTKSIILGIPIFSLFCFIIMVLQHAFPKISACIFDMDGLLLVCAVFNITHLYKILTVTARSEYLANYVKLYHRTQKNCTLNYSVRIDNSIALLKSAHKNNE